VKSPGGAGTPLAEAAYLADADAMRTLIEGGAEINASGDPLQLALWSRCSKCVLSLATTVRPENVVGAAGYFARLGDKEAVDFLLDHGADPNARPWPGLGARGVRGWWQGQSPRFDCDPLGWVESA